MSKVRWDCKFSFEYVHNYKLLQTAFKKRMIQKHVDVDKLILGKYQDNLEFCQWLKGFFDQTCSSGRIGAVAREGYDPVAVRAKGKGGKNVERGRGVGVGANAQSLGMAGLTGSMPGPGSKGVGLIARTIQSRALSSSSRPTSASFTSSGANSIHNIISSSVSSGKSNSAPSSSSSSPTAQTQQLEQQIRRQKAEISRLSSKLSLRDKQYSKLEARYIHLEKKSIDEDTKREKVIRELEQYCADLEVALKDVNSERDFHAEKLRGIEDMLQSYRKKREDEWQRKQRQETQQRQQRKEQGDEEIHGRNNSGVDGDNSIDEWDKMEELVPVENKADEVISWVLEVIYATEGGSLPVDAEGKVSGTHHIVTCGSILFVYIA